MTESSVKILGTGSYLPGDPVGIDQVDDILGRLEELDEKLATRVDRFSQRMLKRSGVKRRHFAIDPTDRRQTETNASMSEKAARNALDAAGLEPNDVDLLICSNPAADLMTPPTSVMLQERLGIKSCTEIEIHSNCTGVPKGVQVAADMLRQGRHRRALVVYSQLSSIFLRREFLNQAKLTLEHLTLRWMLSDGAGALLLSTDDGGVERPELVEAYVESTALGQTPGMKMALGAECGPELAHLPRPYLLSMYEEGHHHLWQNVGKIGRDGAELLLAGLQRMLDEFEVPPEKISKFILPLPGEHFITEESKKQFVQQFGDEAMSRTPFLIADFGYCGGAASLVQFDRMARQEMFEPNDLVAVYVEESSKWMTGGFLARWK